MIKEASPILNLLLAKGVGTKTLSEIVDSLVASGLSPDEMGIDALANELRWRPALKNSALAVQDQVAELAEQLDRQGVCILVRGFEMYPQRLSHVLGKNAPPVLFARGNLSILSNKAVGFCGARHASEKGIRVAGESAKALGAKGINIVSGYAAGVDLAAHCAALEAGGVTTIVLAEGILHFRAKREIKPLLTDDNYVVVSEYSPRLPWNARNAMQRNSTIIGLSDVLVVIESGATGGTRACGEAAMKIGHPLFVADYATPSNSAEGNEDFLNRGAIALRGDRQGRPNLTRVFEVLGMNANIETVPTTEIKTGPVKPSPPSPPAAHTDITPSDYKDKKVQPTYAKRLIEVDLPIARISAHARREKSIRHGHISTLHIWWARRPLAACRAVICAALWPDPADENCPQAFRDAAARHIMGFAHRADGDLKVLETSSKESMARWAALVKKSISPNPTQKAELLALRGALLDFIADFANWDNSTSQPYLETSRALTQAAHEALGGEPGTRPLVVDPFAGGGSIPLEVLRVGADAFASDLNPVAVLLNKVVLEYIPKYGQRLADEVRKWGDWIKKEAEKELAEFYPKDPDGATPIAYLWARTIRCEGAGCGAVVPLIRSLWLAKKANRSVALQLVPNPKTKRVDFQIIAKQRDGWVDQDDPKEKITDPNFDGTVKRASVTCPCCGYTTCAERVREQLRNRAGGTSDARMTVVVRDDPKTGTQYHLPSKIDLEAAAKAARSLASHDAANRLNGHHFAPNEPTPTNESHRSVGSLWIYGMRQWRNVYTDRQLLVLGTLCQYLNKAASRGMSPEAHSLLALGVGKTADHLGALCRWRIARSCVSGTFGRQALPLVWDFGEMNPFAGSAGDWSESIRFLLMFIDGVIDSSLSPQITASEQADATRHSLPSDSADLLATDPPYYDSVAYAELSDYFYVWLKRAVPPKLQGLFTDTLTPKAGQAVVLHPGSEQERARYERLMGEALSEGRRVVSPSGTAVIVFAHKSTSGWETMLEALVGAGWTVTASWPIDTEHGGRMNAYETASLASSVHLVCRPRENPDGSVREDDVGEWRDVLGALPKRIHEWMPRLAEEGVVGADAIFACLGPALEIFSRYSRVEKASGEIATLREYLEHVWAAVSTEALSMIFRDADAAGLEPDARITAMWLWTLGGGKNGSGNGNGNGNGKGPHPNPLPEGEGAETDEGAGDEEKVALTKAKSAGYTLEFDAARKIAQGLGIHLETSESIVEVKGEKARLLPVAERTQYLFGKDAAAGTTRSGKAKKKVKQKTMFDELGEAEAAEAGWTELKGPPPGSTVLDRLHQAMILFAAGRGELMKRFLLDDGIGRDARFWKLAQSLSALYPSGSEEKRWVDGVLARKKGLGL